MMMKMVIAAGIPALTDDARAADPDNPLGYFELEAVKSTRTDATWVRRAGGKAVKVIHALLSGLPPGFSYRIIFMHRNLDEVLESQRKMLHRSAKTGASLAPEALKAVFARQLDAARAWAAAQPNTTCLDVHYHEVIADPLGQARRIARFIERPGTEADMAAAVEASLYRNRAAPAEPRPPARP
jgi:hypothetical protein